MQGLNACGFDPRFGKGFYGTGAYFAEKASYSNNYAYRSGSYRHMFLASVLTGKAKVYGSTLARTLKRPPLLPDGSGLYDSVQGGPHSGSIMYVIYDSDQALPLYFITYK